VPSGLNMALDPLFNPLDILLAVLEIIVKALGVAVEKIWLGWLPGLNRQGPTSMLDIGSNVAWEGIGIGSGKVHVLRTSWRIE
jgi:hypothetical protein